MPMDAITSSGKPAVNFKYNLSQIPFLCVYSIYYKSLLDLKKNKTIASLKKKY